MMRGLLVGAIAAVAIAGATPASAQGFYFGGPGVSIGVGGGPYYGYDRGYGYGHGYYDGRGYGPRAYYYGDAPRAYGYVEGCRTVWIQRRDGSMRRVTRCR